MLELIEELPAGLLAILKDEQPSVDDQMEYQIKFVLANVKINIDSCNLQYDGDDHETFAKLGTAVHKTIGKLFLTSKYKEKHVGFFNFSRSFIGN